MHNIWLHNTCSKCFRNSELEYYLISYLVKKHVLNHWAKQKQIAKTINYLPIFINVTFKYKNQMFLNILCSWDMDTISNETKLVIKLSQQPQ